MPTQKNAHPTKHTKFPYASTNPTDATRGEPIADRASTRKAELEKAHDLLPSTELRARADIEMALAEVNQWLAGDVEHLSHVTAAELNRWLERTKHLAEVNEGAAQDQAHDLSGGRGREPAR